MGNIDLIGKRHRIKSLDFFQQVYKGKNHWYIWILVSLVAFIPFAFRIYHYLFVKVQKPKAPVAIDSNLLLVKGLSHYLFYLVLLLLGVRYLHKRPIRTVFTSKKKIDWWRYIFGVSSWGLCIVVYFSLNYYFYPDNYQWNFKLVPFLILFLVSFTIVPIGAIFKELYFSGYLLQGIGLLTKRKWVAIVLTSVIYMFAIGMSPIFEQAGYHVLFFYFASSLFTGIITTIDDGVELAMGLQTANNIFAILYITTNWTGLRTNALFLDISEPKVLFIVYIPVFIFFPIYFFILKKMYNWKNTKEKILEKIVEIK